MTTVLTRRGLAVGALVSALASTAACGRSTASSSSVAAGAAAVTDDLAALLGRHGLAGRTVEEVVEALDRDPRPRPLSLRAKVRSTSVVLTDDRSELVVPLTGGRHYLAIAPFEATTHECHVHAAGSCSGELPDEPVHVTITSAKGVVLVDTDAVTHANGFVGFWVPRGLKGTVEVACSSKRGQVAFSSDPKGATCLTNLQIN
ncbi:CueP family metal-binding protein [Aestuariimicrobium soli]|uniref:CueP family metal-binding protein n=1 Tax=Aestuariimicrobium soli TaxID=2035834 RepID=UPI003EB8EB63